jgi:DNA primase
MTTHKRTIDFRRVKDAVSIERVLADYGVKLKRSGTQLVGCCPIHKGSNPRAFVVNPAKGAWRCFGDCNRGGSTLDLVAELEGISLRDAALLLIERYSLT